jgi:very-short-patch-repair endonuclease
LTRVLRLAERQWGVLARWQLLELGLTPAAITRWIGSARLHRIYPGVYSVGHRIIPLEGRLIAAILYAGPGAALSHATAAYWWGLLPYLPEIIDVTSPHQRRSLHGIRVHRAQRIERVMRNGLPVTPVARTLRDFAAIAPLGQVRKVVAKADFKHLLDLDAIDQVIGVGRPGSAKLNRALSLHRPEYAQTRSDLEALFLDLCRRHRLAFPRVNVKVGPYTVDALWGEEQLVVELDGGDNHSSYAQMQADRERELYLRRAGYAVRRYSWRQVTRERSAVAADVRHALHAARAAGASPA